MNNGSGFSWRMEMGRNSFVILSWQGCDPPHWHFAMRTEPFRLCRLLLLGLGPDPQGNSGKELDPLQLLFRRRMTEPVIPERMHFGRQHMPQITLNELNAGERHRL